MRIKKKVFYRVIAIAIAIIIAACGSGGTLSGGGESGLGGTGIGLVKGEIAAVETALQNKQTTEQDSILLASFNLLIAEAYAQTGSLAGITVSGGGLTVTTNVNGEFLLFDVEPSANFVLSFILPFGQTFEFDIGSVSKGEAIVVSDIRFNEATGGASFGSIESFPFIGDVSDFVLSSPPISAEEVIEEVEEARRAEEERLAQEEAEEDVVEEVEEDPVDGGDADPTDDCPPGQDCDGDGIPDDAI